MHAGFALAVLMIRLAWVLLVLAARIAPYAITAAILAFLWPVVTVAAAAVTGAWAAGLHPARLLRMAAGALVMPAAYLAAAAWRWRAWAAPAGLHLWAAEPWHDYLAGSLALLTLARPAGLIAGAFPLAVPLGLAVAAGAWAWRRARMANGLGGRTAYAPIAFDARQWRRQARTARRDARPPGRVRLTARRGVPVGVTIRTVTARWTRVLAIPVPEFGRHTVIVGSSGSGKTTLMIRLWAGWFAAALRAARRDRAARPLLIVIDAKGGHDSRTRAAQTAAALHAAGAGRVAVWPDQAALNLWDTEPRALAVLLHQLIESGDGSAAYYADMSAAVVRLAVCAPQGPPRSAAAFLDRLNANWLARAYAGGSTADREQALAAARHVPDIAMRYAQLLDRLGPALDGDGSLSDPAVDAWYCILEGTAEPSVAEAQAMALTELAARAAVTPDAPRTILLAADDYSAVSRRVPLSNLYERGRSLGLGVMVSAQSWEGLGADDDERQRIVSTADGGVWLLRTPDPDPLTTLAGSVERLASGRKLTGPGTTGDEGNSRVQHMWSVQPNLVRRFSTGQACYIRHGTAVYVHVVPAPLAKDTRRPGDPGSDGRADAPPAPPAWPASPRIPGTGPHEDDVLGPGTGP
jgi:hypothetical protein